jgi:hypothetical protein
MRHSSDIGLPFVRGARRHPVSAVIIDATDQKRDVVDAPLAARTGLGGERLLDRVEQRSVKNWLGNVPSNVEVGGQALP